MSGVTLSLLQGIHELALEQLHFERLREIAYRALRRFPHGSPTYSNFLISVSRTDLISVNRMAEPADDDLAGGFSRLQSCSLCRRWVMKFFVPGQSPEHAEEIYNDFQALHKASDKRIRSITFLDRELQKEVQLCVGQDEPWYGGKILLILLCYPRGFQVFTQERGIDSGSPIMIQTTDARVEEFDRFDQPNKLGRGA
jgi:hypothetical protein